MEKSELELILNPYDIALTKANCGISLMDARTAEYWAVLTWLEIDPRPLLEILASFGCGKSDLAKAISCMCKEAEKVEGKTYATARDQLGKVSTAVIDENEDIPENLLVKRWSNETSSIYVKRPKSGGKWEDDWVNIAGFSLVVGRSPFQDVALNSRCIVISPESVPEKAGDCEVTNAGSIKKVADLLGKLDISNGDRTMQVWAPLWAVAEKLGDYEWLDWARSRLEAEGAAIRAVKSYEPYEAILEAYEVCHADANGWIKISDIKNMANTENDLDLKGSQITEMLARHGCETTTLHGYKVVRRESSVLIEKLEEEIHGRQGVKIR